MTKNGHLRRRQVTSERSLRRDRGKLSGVRDERATGTAGGLQVTPGFVDVPIKIMRVDNLRERVRLDVDFKKLETGAHSSSTGLIFTAVDDLEDRSKQSVRSVRS